MKKIYLFLTMALALIGVGAAWAGYVAIIGDQGKVYESSELKAGDAIAIKGAGKAYYLTAKEGALVGTNGLPSDNETFILEAAGTKIKGFDAFYLKNATTGTYITVTANYPSESENNELIAGFTAEKSQANAFIFINVKNDAKNVFADETIDGKFQFTDEKLEKVDADRMMIITSIPAAAGAATSLRALDDIYLDSYWDTADKNPTYGGKSLVIVDDYFDSNYMLVFRMREGAGVEVAMQQLQQLLSKVESVNYLATGGPGSYDKTLVEAFVAAKQAASALNGDAEATESDLQLAMDNLNAAWDALKAATPAPMAEGYFWICSAFDVWNVEGVSSCGIYSGGEDVKWFQPVSGGYDATNPNWAWHIIKSEDGENYMIQNVGQGVYIAKGFAGTGNKEVIVTKELDKAATFTVQAGAIPGAFAFGMNDVVGTLNQNGDKDYKMGEKLNFLHCLGHGGGTGKNGKLGFWGADAAVSQWYLYPITEEKIQELDEIGAQRTRTNTFTTLLSKAQTASDAAHVWVFGEDITPKETSAYDSNAGMSVDHGLSWTEDTNDAGGKFGKDGQGFSALYDGSVETFFHTTWNDQPKDGDAYLPHFLTVELTKAASEIQIHFTQRGGGGKSYNTPSVFTLAVSNDGTSWTELPDSVKGYDASAIEIHIPAIDLKAAYKHIKMSVYHTVGLNGKDKCAGDGNIYPFWNLSGLKITLGAPTLDPACQASTMPADVVKGLEDALTVATAVDQSKATQADIDALQVAYDAFVAQFADPTELKTLITKAEAKSKTFLAVDKIGANGASTVNNLPAAIEAAQKVLTTAYTDAKLKEAVDKLQSEMDAFDATLITKPDPTKWYQIRISDAETKAQFGWTLPNADFNGQVAAISKGKTSEDFYTQYDEGNTQIWFHAESDLTGKEDLSYFRFIEIADGKYYMQNKATGRFIRWMGTSTGDQASYCPTVITIDALGGGQTNLIALTFAGAKLNPLHMAASGILMAYGEYGLNTRSTLEVVPVANVTVNEEEIGVGYPTALDYLQGKFYPTCFPSSIKNLKGATAYQPVGYVEEGDGVYSIGFTAVEDGEIKAGEPFILKPEGKTFTVKDTYTADDSCTVRFNIGTEAVLEGKNVNGLQGTFVALTAAEGTAIISQIDDAEGKLNVVTKDTKAADKSVAALTAYFKLMVEDVTKLPVLEDEADIYLTIEGGELVSIKNARVVLKNKAIYTLSGMRVDAKNLKAGHIYIINGRKTLIP